MLFECPYEKLHFIYGIKSGHFSPFSMIFPENLTISTLLWCRTIILTSVIQLLRKLSQVHLLDEGKANSISLSLGFSVVSRYARLFSKENYNHIFHSMCSYAKWSSHWITKRWNLFLHGPGISARLVGDCFDQ